MNGWSVIGWVLIAAGSTFLLSLSVALCIVVIKAALSTKADE